MQIKQKFITSNNKGKANGNRPRFIVIHDTGNSKPSANAENHYRWLQNTPDTNASAHVFVDDHEAIQVIQYTTPAWHTGKLYVSKPQVPECSNFNSIGIEFCINQDGNLTRTLSNTVAVVAQLMEQFNIPLKNVITHQMSAGKKCPSTFISNPKLYNQFQYDLKEYIENKNQNNQAVNQAITYLHQKGVIKTPEYWINHLHQIEHLDELLQNMQQVLMQAEKRD